MSIIDSVASRTGQKGGAANRAVALRCQADPALLAELRPYLNGPDRALQSDAAEVFTETAKRAPALVAPYVDGLLGILGTTNNRALWEMLGALSLVAPLVPDAIAPHVGALLAAAREGSVIVVDRSVTTLAAVAHARPEMAPAIVPGLLEVLVRADGRDAPKLAERILPAVAGQTAFASQMADLVEAVLPAADGTAATRLRKVLKKLGRA